MDKLKPYFSIVIPTYNRAEKLRKTLQSVISQSFTDFEVLVIDDGSTDNTKVIVESFQDNRIIYAWMENSGGPATPRNFGINKARADWICFLDADDAWYPEKLMSVQKSIESKPELDLICHNEIMLELAAGKRSLLRHGPFEIDFYRVMLTYGNRVSTSATTVRRAFLNENNLRFNQSPDYVIVEDYDMWLRVALYGGKFHFISDSLGEYIIENDNISSNIKKMQHNYSVLIDNHVYRLQGFQADKDKLWRHINSVLLMSESVAIMVSGRYVAGIGLVVSALRCSFSGVLGYTLSKISKSLRG